jgi:HK97 family phage portal protein
LEFSLSLGSKTPAKRSATSNLESPGNWILKLLGSETASGVKVGPDSALRFGAVYSCVRLVSETVGFISMDVMQKTDQGRTIAENHHVQKLIHDRPNRKQSPFSFRRNLMVMALTRGNGFAYIRRNQQSGQPVAIDFIHADKVFQISEIDDVLYYHVQGFKLPVPDYDIIHIKTMGTDGVWGLSPIRLHAESVGNAMAAQTFNGKHYKNGGFFKGFLKYPGTFKEDAQRIALGNDWDKLYSGPDAIGGTPVLERGIEYVPISLPQKDAQYIESQKFGREDIAGIFNVPVNMIGDLTGSNFSTLEQQNIQFTTYSIGPWLTQWEQELTFKLLSESERAAGYHIRVNVNALLRGDLQTRSNFYTQMRNIGVYSANDIRAKEGENPRPDPQGDEYIVQVNTQSSEQTELQKEKTQAEIDNLKDTGNGNQE